MKKIVVTIIIFSLLFSTFSVASSKLQETEQEYQKLNNEIQKLEKQMQSTASTQKKVTKEINSLEGNIKSLETQIEVLEDSIKVKESELVILNDKLAQADKSLLENKDEMYSRLRVMYKSKNIGFIEVVLGAKDIEDLLTRIDLIKRIQEHDSQMIKDLTQLRNDISSMKVEVEEVKANLVSQKSELDSKQNDLTGNLEDLEVKKVELSKDLEELERREDELNKEAQELTKIIQKLKLEAKYVGGEMMWPVPSSYRITSAFGNRYHPILKKYKMHTGIDIGAKSGSNIVAAQTGTVIYSNYLGSYGKVIMIDHGGGYVTLYAHSSKLIAKNGQKVTKGDVIALVGSTGLSTGPHLHFEVRKNGEFVDPVQYVSAK
jgi:murein DD-endopeptidase MepM/ murein hydrolase activator NlpD